MDADLKTDDANLRDYLWARKIWERGNCNEWIEFAHNAIGLNSATGDLELMRHNLKQLLDWHRALAGVEVALAGMEVAE